MLLEILDSVSGIFSQPCLPITNPKSQHAHATLLSIWDLAFTPANDLHTWQAGPEQTSLLANLVLWAVYFYNPVLNHIWLRWELNTNQSGGRTVRYTLVQKKHWVPTSTFKMYLLRGWYWTLILQNSLDSMCLEIDSITSWYEMWLSCFYFFLVCVTCLVCFYYFSWCCKELPFIKSRYLSKLWAASSEAHEMRTTCLSGIEVMGSLSVLTQRFVWMRGSHPRCRPVPTLPSNPQNK